MFVHNVVFWLKEDLSEADRAAFRAALEALEAVESVRAIYVGAAVASERPVVDDSFSVALTVVFDDQAGHDAYQVSDGHRAFVERFSPLWTKILVFDAA